MLKPDQVDRLNLILKQRDLPENPLMRLIIVSEKANLDLEDVIEHLLVQRTMLFQDENQTTDK
jgi:hypothetical protein